MRASASIGKRPPEGIGSTGQTIRDRIDLAAVATALLGPAPGRRGERGRRLWWRCPFHDDQNPSFCVDPGKPTLEMLGLRRAWGRRRAGDATSRDDVPRGRPLAWPSKPASSRPRGSRPARGPRPPGRPPRPPGEAARATLGVAPGRCPGAGRGRRQSASGRPRERAALAYLEGRGLTAETIHAARLGWTPRVMLPTTDGVRYWRASGIVIPWLDGDRLAMVKIRQPEGRKPKYAEAFRDRPSDLSGPEAIRPGMPLVIVEGEFDALLLGQELADLAGVVTTGSASSPTPRDRLPGDAPLPSMVRRARCRPGWRQGRRRVAGPSGPSQAPAPGKDWTEAHQAGIDLRRWWLPWLDGTGTVR